MQGRGRVFPLAAILLLFAGPLRPADVRSFGATGDGKTKDTAAFQKALADHLKPFESAVA